MIMVIHALPDIRHVFLEARQDENDNGLHETDDYPDYRYHACVYVLTGSHYSTLPRANTQTGPVLEESTTRDLATVNLMGG